MRITKSQFAGNAGVSDGVLSAALRGIAQTLAARSAAAVADLVNSSGGAGNGAILNVPDFTLSVLGSTNAVAKAEAEAGAVNVINGLSNIIAQINAVRATMPEVFAAVTDSTGGVAGGSNTIGAIDVSATGANAALASAAGMNVLFEKLRSRIAQAAGYVNKLCEATGVTPLTVALSPISLPANAAIFAAISTNTGSTVSGATVAAADACILKTEWDARQVLLADAISDLAVKLNAITADANATRACPVIAA